MLEKHHVLAPARIVGSHTAADLPRSSLNLFPSALADQGGCFAPRYYIVSMYCGRCPCTYLPGMRFRISHSTSMPTLPWKVALDSNIIRAQGQYCQAPLQYLFAAASAARLAYRSSTPHVGCISPTTHATVPTARCHVTNELARNPAALDVHPLHLTFSMVWLGTPIFDS